MQAANVVLELQKEIAGVEKTGDGYRVLSADGIVETTRLVIATGGKSIPKMGATGFAYRIAEQFGLSDVETRPGLVPLTLDHSLLERLEPLSGIAAPAELRHARTTFRGALPFTPHGMRGEEF